MEKVITYIEQNLNKERLEAVSSSVINAYKGGDYVTIKSYAEALNLPSSGSVKQIFYSLIQLIHPDRIELLLAEFNKARDSSDIVQLNGIRQLLEVREQAGAVREKRFEYQHTETWSVPSDETYYEDHEADADVFEDSSSAGGFFDAVKDVIFGNHDFYLEPADLGQIDGGLDLAFCSLEGIEGIEYCRNLRLLNISGNDISNIYDLQELTQLEELYAAGNAIRDIDALLDLNHLEIVDLSDNDIEDISALLSMSSLKFVDIRKNPIQDRELISSLEAAGVIVLY